MTEKTAPQPLTDEEANHYWMVRRPNCDCTACRAIARIRADGRKIELLERTIQDFIDQRPYECIHGLLRDYRCRECEANLKAALEDKTK